MKHIYLGVGALSTLIQEDPMNRTPYGRLPYPFAWATLKLGGLLSSQVSCCRWCASMTSSQFPKGHDYRHLPCLPSANTSGQMEPSTDGDTFAEGVIEDDDVFGPNPADPAMFPRSGFVYQYMVWLRHYSDAPSAYHLAAALSGLSVISRPTFGVAGLSHTGVHLYQLLVGRSGLDRKSSSTAPIQSLLEVICPTSVGMSPGSHQALGAGLAEAPVQLLIENEFKRLLEQAANKAGPLGAVKALLTDLYDGRRFSKRLTTEAPIVVDTPRLSLLACITPSDLEETLTSADIHGGFLNRFCVINARRRRWKPLRPLPQQAIMDLRNSLWARYKLGAFEAVSWNAEAQEYMDWWAAQMDLFLQSLPSHLSSACSRIPAHAYKVAALYALDLACEQTVAAYGAIPEGGSTQPITITLEALGPALCWAAVLCKSILGVYRSLATTAPMRIRRDVIRVLTGNSKNPKGHRRWVDIGAITLGTSTLKTQVQPVLDTLLAQGIIELQKGREGTGFKYALTRRAMQTDGDPNTPDAPVDAGEDPWLAELDSGLCENGKKPQATWGSKVTSEPPIKAPVPVVPTIDPYPCDGVDLDNPYSGFDPSYQDEIHIEYDDG